MTEDIFSDQRLSCLMPLRLLNSSVHYLQESIAGGEEAGEVSIKQREELGGRILKSTRKLPWCFNDWPHAFPEKRLVSSHPNRHEGCESSILLQTSLESQRFLELLLLSQKGFTWFDMWGKNAQPPT